MFWQYMASYTQRRREEEGSKGRLYMQAHAAHSYSRPWTTGGCNAITGELQKLSEIRFAYAMGLFVGFVLCCLKASHH